MSAPIRTRAEAQAATAALTPAKIEKLIAGLRAVYPGRSDREIRAMLRNFVAGA